LCLVVRHARVFQHQTSELGQQIIRWLYKDFFRVVKHYTPDWVVFENVRGLLETEGGVFVDKILAEFNRLGYTTSLKLLNAIDFGVPQKRTRLFIVGSLHGGTFKYPEPTVNKPVTVKQAINDLPTLQNGASENYLLYDKAARPFKLYKNYA